MATTKTAEPSATKLHVPPRGRTGLSRAQRGGPVGSTLGADTLPAGLGASLLDADVSQELRDSTPTFGNVLRSIGLGVAASQQALDASLVDTVRRLSDTTIKVVTDVIQKLDDDGLPVTASTQLVTNELSVLNFVTPTVHQWEQVNLSMDLTVGSFEAEQGLVFHRNQWDIAVHTYGLFWGFIGWTDTHNNSSDVDVTRQTRQEQDWAEGQVRLDALLAPRRTTKFPVPAQVAIGPQLFFTLGSITETAGAGGGITARSIEVTIRVLKRDGGNNPSKNITLDSGGLLQSFITGGGFTGSTTNADGLVKVTLTRNLNPFFSRPVRFVVKASLGSVSRTTSITL